MVSCLGRFCMNVINCGNTFRGTAVTCGKIFQITEARRVAFWDTNSVSQARKKIGEHARCGCPCQGRIMVGSLSDYSPIGLVGTVHGFFGSSLKSRIRDKNTMWCIGGWFLLFRAFYVVCEEDEVWMSIFGWRLNARRAKLIGDHGFRKMLPKTRGAKSTFDFRPIAMVKLLVIQNIYIFGSVGPSQVWLSHADWSWSSVCPLYNEHPLS